MKILILRYCLVIGVVLSLFPNKIPLILNLYIYETKINYRIGCLAVLTFSSCSKDDNTPVNPQNVNSKRLTLNASPRDSWLYVNLETGDTVTAKDVNEWEYHEFIIENGKYKKKPDGTLDYKVTKTIPAGKPNAPKTWHLAFHVYDALINNGEALMTNETELSKLTEMPKGNYAR